MAEEARLAHEQRMAESALLPALHHTGAPDTDEPDTDEAATDVALAVAEGAVVWDPPRLQPFGKFEMIALLLEAFDVTHPTEDGCADRGAVSQNIATLSQWWHQVAEFGVILHLKAYPQPTTSPESKSNPYSKPNLFMLSKA